MKNLFAIMFMTIVWVVSASAQTDIQLKGLRRLPEGLTVAKLKTHVIEPEHTRNIEMEEVNPAREVKYKFSTTVRKTKFKTKPKLNTQLFGEAIHSALKDKVVGYILQIRQNGTPIHAGVWNWAQTPANQNIPWNENARMHIASVSKFLTAVGLVKLLDEKGISYDAKIIDYLPDFWSKGNNIDKITFRHLLTHRSGFGGSSSDSNYAFMKGKVAQGVAGVGSYDYENMNFGLMRILIPVINGDINKNFKFPPEVPNEVKAINDKVWDGATIGYYKEYMQKEVFTPAGVSNADFKPISIPATGVIDGALAYAFPFSNQTTGWNSGDLATMAGGAAWRLSIKELLNVMNHVRRKNTIIPAQKAQYMLDNFFGIDQAISTDAGMIYNKNGRWNGSGKTEQCVAHFLPNGMEVVMFVNSPIGTENFSLRGVINDAFINSLAD